MLIFIALLFAACLLPAQTQQVAVGTRGAPSGSQLSITAVPSPGKLITNWSSRNVFDFSDGTASDWRMWIATANDAREGGIYQQDIQLRKTPAPVQISDLAYTGTGVIGPSEDRFGGHSFTHFSGADNDRSSVDYGGPYFTYIGNGGNFARYFESSSFVLKCLDNANLIPGCGENFTITPALAGAQNAFVWVRAEGIDTRVTVTGAGTIETVDLPAGVPEYEGVIQIPLNPADDHTSYTISIAPSAAQPGVTTGFLGFTRAKLGGPTPGNVAQSVLGTVGSTTPQDRTYGSRVHQLDPAQRVPAATNSITLAAGNDLQAALNMAPGGTDIHLPLGFVSGPIILPNRRTDNGWVRIIADGAPSLNPGRRANPIDYPGGANSPAKIVTHNEGPAILNYQGTPFDTDLAARAAHHYELLGLEIVADGTAAVINYGIVSFLHGGGYGIPQPALDGSSQPHDLLIVGCYIHRVVATLPNQVNAVLLWANASGIYDSYISNARITGGFSQQVNAVNVNDTAGPLTVKNNYLEAPGSDMIIGGGATIPFAVPMDIEILGNLFDKDLFYNTPDSSGNYPNPQDVKNGLEFKTGQYVTISGNVFYHMIAGNHYANGQDGQCIFIRAFNAGGSQPQETAHYLIENNIMMNSSVGLALDPFDASGTGDPNRSDFQAYTKVPNHFIPRSHDFMVRNNLMTRFSFTKWGLQGRGFYAYSALFNINYPPVNLTITRNTGSFDWAADMPYIASGPPTGPDVSLHNDGGTITALDVININARRGLTGSPYAMKDPEPYASAEANASWVMTNNILAGGADGAGGNGAISYSYLMTWTNNSYYGVLPGYLNDRMQFPTAPADSGHIFGNTTTTDTTMPVVPGRGVDSSTLPDECSVRTGNRSDIFCDAGYMGITIAQSSHLLMQGGSASFVMNFSADHLSGAITPMVTGLPSGVTVSFSPTTLPAAGGTTTATLAASGFSPLGTISATATGTAGITAVSTPLAVTVFPSTVGNYGEVIRSVAGESNGQLITNSADSSNNLIGANLTRGPGRGLAGRVPIFNGTSAGARGALVMPTAFDTSTAFSGCIRICPKSFGGTQNLMGNIDADNRNVGWTFFLGGGSGSNLVFGLIGAGASKQLTVIGPTIPLNTWSSGCFTYDGSGRSSGVRIYTGGTSGASVVYQELLGGASIASTAPLGIGAQYGSGHTGPVFQFFNGALADIHIAPGVFSSLAIATLHADTRQ